MGLGKNMNMDLICKGYAVNINDLKLTEYLPEKFEQMKQFYTNEEILASLMSVFNYQKLTNLTKEEGGRSEAFIFLTHDQRFIIKTITKVERKLFLSKMVAGYLERIKDCPESKLVRILGVFKIQPMNQSLIIMENLLLNKEKCVIFDLKGSKVARLVKGIEDPLSPPCGRVLKDTNFYQYCKKIELDEKLKVKMIETLKLDFDFLKKCGVIDYSLLLGIYENEASLESSGRPLLIAEEGTRYNLGIIDIFQEYNFLKAGEKTIKTIFNNKKDISIATPTDYFLRISEFCSEIFQ